MARKKRQDEADEGASPAEHEGLIVLVAIKDATQIGISAADGEPVIYEVDEDGIVHVHPDHVAACMNAGCRPVLAVMLE